MRRYYFISIIFLSLTSQVLPQNYFPLEIGNRWDYRHEYHYPGGVWVDTFSIEIVGQKILSNDLEYFEFSNPLPFGNYHPKFVREEETKIYFFDEGDSIDCFAFRFDLPRDTFYLNCKNNQTFITEVIDSIYFWGVSTVNQRHWIGWEHQYSFFDKIGIYEYDKYWVLTEDYYDLSGCIISDTTYGELLVSVANINQNPTNFNLSQNYPNPFNPTTTIKYQIPDLPAGRQGLSFVTLKVHDVLGNKVAALINEEKPAGSYEVDFDASGLTSGVYFYRLQTGEFVETKKMILLR